MKLTSAAGAFFFHEATPIVFAQLIRDTVTSAVLSPKPGDQRITTADTAQQFIRNHSSNLLTQVDFHVVLI